MTVIGPQFEKYLEKLSTYKQTANLEKKSVELELIEQLIDRLGVVSKRNIPDWGITYQQLFNIKISCCPLIDSDISKLVVESIEPYCDNIIAFRKAFAHEVLNFVHDYKSISNKSVFSAEKYNADIVPYLAQLLNSREIPSSLSQISFEKVIDKMNESLAFSKTDLRNWLRLREKQDTRLLKEIETAENLVPRVYFPAGEYKIDPLLRERYDRYRLYQEQRVEDVLTESKVLLHLSKNENQSANEMIVEEMSDFTVKEQRTKPSSC